MSFIFFCLYYDTKVMISAKIENATRGIIRDVQQMRAQKLTGLHLLWNNPLCCFLEYVLK